MSKISRDAKLIEMAANVKTYATKRKAALVKEALWLKKVRTAHGNSVRAEANNRYRLGVVKEINELLKP